MICAHPGTRRAEFSMERNSLAWVHGFLPWCAECLFLLYEPNSLQAKIHLKSMFYMSRSTSYCKNWIVNKSMSINSNDCNNLCLRSKRNDKKQRGNCTNVLAHSKSGMWKLNQAGKIAGNLIRQNNSLHISRIFATCMVLHWLFSAECKNWSWEFTVHKTIIYGASI